MRDSVLSSCINTVPVTMKYAPGTCIAKWKIGNRGFNRAAILPFVLRGAVGSVHQQDIRGHYEGEWLLSRSGYTKPWNGKHGDHPMKRGNTGRAHLKNIQEVSGQERNVTGSWCISFFSCIQASKFANQSQIL